MSFVGLIHLVASCLALVAGAVVLLRRKGTRFHRRLGYAYVGSMVALNVTALMIYRLFGGFGPFHVAALVSLATVVPAVVAARRRRPGWLARHYYWMTFSYVGLLAAGASEVATRLPDAPFWGAVAASSIAVILVGAWWIYRRAPEMLSRFGSSPAS